VTTAKAKSVPRSGNGPVTLDVTIGITQLHNGVGMALPAYQSEQAAGLDLAAAVSEGEGMTLKPGGRALVPTGLVVELPAGYEGQVRPRSGLALRHGVTVLNSPGTIDSDYRGEVSVLLINLGVDPVMIHRGDRIAQLVVAPVARATLAVNAVPSATGRGDGGFGSTGTATAEKKSNLTKTSRSRKKSS
jgi:dUTP pyrophosphatase